MYAIESICRGMLMHMAVYVILEATVNYYEYFPLRQLNSISLLVTSPLLHMSINDECMSITVTCFWQSNVNYSNYVTTNGNVHQVCAYGPSMILI